MLLGLESGMTLIVHLRMTGRLITVAGNAPLPSHTHVVMTLEHGERLIFQDARKFGRLWLTPDPAMVLAHLGPEPFAADFTPAYLAARLHGRAAPIKALLLDQRIVAGLGNIYVAETLFRARISPLRLAGNLAEPQVHGHPPEPTREAGDRNQDRPRDRNAQAGPRVSCRSLRAIAS